MHGVAGFVRLAAAAGFMCGHEDVYKRQLLMGVFAFGFGTAGGVLLGKLMCKLTHGKVNPLIGSAGVSAVPMAARVSQVVGQKDNPSNFLLMHAMGPVSYTHLDVYKRQARRRTPRPTTAAASCPTSRTRPTIARS